MTTDRFVVAQERDAVASRFIVRIAVAAMLIGGIGVALAAAILDAGPAPGGGPSSIARSGTAVAPRDIGMVTQTLIAEERHARELRDEQRKALEAYGWVDRSQGIARIPIDEAINLVVAECAGQKAAMDGGARR